MRKLRILNVIFWAAVMILLLQLHIMKIYQTPSPWARQGGAPVVADIK